MTTEEFEKTEFKRGMTCWYCGSRYKIISKDYYTKSFFLARLGENELIYLVRYEYVSDIQYPAK